MRAGVQIFARRRNVVLRFGQKEEGGDRSSELERQIAGVFGDTDDLVFPLGSGAVLAEVPADGVFVPEKLSGKRFIDDGHVARVGSILLLDAAPPENRISSDVEVTGGRAIPECEDVGAGSGSGMSIHPNSSAPVVASERRVDTERDRIDAGNSGKRIVDALVQRRELLCTVAGQSRLEIHDHAPILIESEILIFQPLERGG